MKERFVVFVIGIGLIITSIILLKTHIITLDNFYIYVLLFGGGGFITFAGILMIIFKEDWFTGKPLQQSLESGSVKQ